jgi:hypothetical protein
MTNGHYRINLIENDNVVNNISQIIIPNFDSILGSNHAQPVS